MNKKIVGLVVLLVFLFNTVTVTAFPPIVSIDNLAGDTIAPYFDLINDGDTNMVLSITSNDAKECKYSDTPGFDPGLQGISCIVGSPSSSVCQLGNLAEGSYTRYYACKNKNAWSTNAGISFDVNFISSLSASITSPLTGENVVIGTLIDFNSNIFNNAFPYTVEWDSNKDIDWKKTNENFSSSELSIGEHNITLKAVFDLGGSSVTKTDSVQINIFPVPNDVLGITVFEVIPETQIRINSTIQVNATITNSSSQEKDANIVLAIINAETGLEDFRDKTQNPIINAGSSENAVYSIDLASIGLKKGNYKIKLDVKEYSPEQNTTNNHSTKIITVLKERKEIQAGETSVLILPAILIAILLILKKEKIGKQKKIE